MTMKSTSGFVASASFYVLGKLISRNAEPVQYDASEYPEDGIL